MTVLPQSIEFMLSHIDITVGTLGNGALCNYSLPAYAQTVNSIISLLYSCEYNHPNVDLKKKKKLQQIQRI